MLKISVAITVIGLIMLFLGISSYITATYKNETRGMFVFLIALAVVMIIGGGISIPKALAQQKASERPAPAGKQTAMSSITNKDQDRVFDGGAAKRAAARQKLNEQRIEKQLTNNYVKIGNVSFDHKSKTYTLIIKDKSFNQAMAYLKAHPNSGKAVSWPKDVSDFEKMSSSISRSLGSQYKLEVQATIPTKQTILVVANGQKIQSFVK